MPHISKRKLEPQHLKKLYRQLSRTITRLDQSKTNVFLEELLGKEEKIMIAKRFAAIVMLIENNSTYRIAQLLYMSPSTIERLKKNYTMGTYDSIEKLLKENKEVYEQLWKSLEVILCAGLPPRGRGRWKSTFDMLTKK